MKTKSNLTSAILLACLAAISTAISQEPPRSGIYQIQSGAYLEVGGFGGVYSFTLPNSSQMFVSLNIDAGGSAQLTFLGYDRQTVFRRLTNGIASSNVVRFQYQTAYPAAFPTGLTAYVDYTITNAAGRLWIAGAITSPTVCCDIPNQFEHEDVVATFVPALVLSVTNGVELRWSSASNQNYQIQWAPDLMTWTNLGGMHPGNGSTNYAADAVPQAPSQRFYRVITPP